MMGHREEETSYRFPIEEETFREKGKDAVFYVKRVVVVVGVDAKE